MFFIELECCKYIDIYQRIKFKTNKSETHKSLFTNNIYIINSTLTQSTLIV